MKYIKITLVILSILFLAACATFPKKSGPGLYVNGWPTFILSYPTDWVEKIPEPTAIFKVQAPEGVPSLQISLIPNMSIPLKSSTRLYIPELAKIGKSIKVIHDKETKLDDGTPAQEAELEWVMNPGIKLNTLFLTTKKEDVWITISLTDTKGRIGEDLKGIPYSLKIKPGKEELVGLPADIQEVLNQLCKDMVSHDVEKVMLHYSNQFLHNGRRKADVEAFYKSAILGITSFQINITRFESQKNNAYMAGYALVNETMRVPLPGMSLIKEDGQWKYYGNQK